MVVLIFSPTIGAMYCDLSSPVIRPTAFEIKTVCPAVPFILSSKRFSSPVIPVVKNGAFGTGVLGSPTYPKICAPAGPIS